MIINFREQGRRQQLCEYDSLNCYNDETVGSFPTSQATFRHRFNYVNLTWRLSVNRQCIPWRRCFWLRSASPQRALLPPSAR